MAVDWIARFMGLAPIFVSICFSISHSLTAGVIVSSISICFKNTILIMTSNAGAQRIIDPKNLGFGAEQTQQQDYDKMKSNVMEEVKRLLNGNAAGARFLMMSL